MGNTEEQIAELEKELSACPTGYISRKTINGKERFYLQWTENGKLKSRYIKAAELETIRDSVEKRKQIQAELKRLKSTPEGIRELNMKRKETRNMKDITGTLMSGDKIIAKIQKGVITEFDDTLLPLYLKRTRDLDGWLASRAIDSHRTNSRLLKKALRLKNPDDAQTVLAVNAATITDCYWFRPEGSTACYEDIRFKENYFDMLALRGDPDSFSRRPSRTPELTNIGSFEKCWKLIDGQWWMYKSGNSQEYFSELFICRLGEKLGLSMAHYEIDGEYIRSLDFTEGAKVNFEPIKSIVGENEEYENCFTVLNELSSELARQYLLLIWMDSICYNMDRHTENFGFLRNVQTGEILSLAPNYDNNIALIAKGYPKDKSREHDGLIRFFREFLQNCQEALNMYREMSLPQITGKMIDECFKEIPIKADEDFIRAFILSGQERIREIIFSEEINQDEDDTSQLML